MGNESLRFKIFSGGIWRFIGRISAQLVTTAVTIILARILTPDDYGTIAIITVFINICNMIATTSFGSALIQKKNADNLDFSSVFYISLLVTFTMYAALFFCAPIISDLYEMPILTPLLRVMGLKLPFTAINSIQEAQISREFAFRKNFFATMVGTVISAIVGIVMAVYGFGAWALCGQYLTHTIITTIMLSIITKWRPRLLFSLKRALALFSYGWKLLTSSLLEELNIELKSFFIGKVYSSADLAYYNRGKQFPALINTNISDTINSVLFPAMALKQDDNSVLRAYLNRSIKLSTFVIFPLQIGLAIVAEPFTMLLLTEKWLPCVPFLQIMCVCYCFTPVFTANAQVLKAVGKTNYYLLASALTNLFGIAVLLIVLKYGVIYIALSGLLSTLFMTVAFSLPCTRKIKYGLHRQIFDLIPNIINTAAMALITIFVGSFLHNTVLKLIVQILVGIVSYVLVSLITRNDSMKYIINLIKSSFRKRRVK